MPQPTENSWSFITKESPSASGQTGGVVAGAGTVELETVGDKLTDSGTLDAEVPDVTISEPPRETLLVLVLEVAIGDNEADKEFGPAELIGIDGSEGLMLDGIKTEADDERLGVPGIAATEDVGAVGVKLTLGPENEGILLIELEALVLVLEDEN